MAYHKKPSKKMYGGKKKKMYKKGSFLEPGKEIKFGGPMKKQRGGARPVKRLELLKKTPAAESLEPKQQLEQKLREKQKHVRLSAKSL